MRFRIPGTRLVFVLGLIDLEKTVIGLNSTSFCEEGKQILMLDYDKLDLEGVRDDVERLQRKYGLPRILLFESSPGKYHAYCMASLSFHEAMIITYDSQSDEHHKECLLANKKSTLRTTPKKGRSYGIRYMEQINSCDMPRHAEIPEAVDILLRVLHLEDWSPSLPPIPSISVEQLPPNLEAGVKSLMKTFPPGPPADQDKQKVVAVSSFAILMALREISKTDKKIAVQILFQSLRNILYQTFPGEELSIINGIQQGFLRLAGFPIDKMRKEALEYAKQRETQEKMDVRRGYG